MYLFHEHYDEIEEEKKIIEQNQQFTFDRIAHNVLLIIIIGSICVMIVTVE